jgi:hypothetical protein
MGTTISREISMTPFIPQNLSKVIADIARSKAISTGEATAILVAAGARALTNAGEVQPGHAKDAQAAAHEMINSVQQSARTINSISGKARAMLEKVR